MQKYKDSEIKSFEFSDLKGTHVVPQGEFKSFNFQELNGEPVMRNKVSEDTIRSERAFERKNNFKIEGVVRDSRGLSKQENSDFESRIQDEVKRRIEAVYQKAYNEGLEKGKQDGHAQAMAEHQAALSQKIEDFTKVIDTIHLQNDKLLESKRHEIFEFIKRFTKWIVLKEIDEKVYLEKLFEKLVLEINARKNLIVKIGKANFNQMPEIIQAVESRIGQLSNIRVEIVPEIQYPGIILESENGLIDGSLEGVFLNIDKIFEQVANHE